MSHHHHHNYPNHGRPHRLSPTGGDSHSGSLYSEGRTVLPPLTIAFPTSNSPVPTNVPNTHAQRSSPMPYGQNYYAPAQQQQTFVPDPTYPSFQQLSDTRYHGGQTHGGSYNRTSPFSGSADPRYPPPLDVPGDGRGQWQGQPYYAPHSDLQIPPSNDLRSPHSVYSPASSYPQYQSAASSTYSTGSSRGVHTPAATHAQYQQPVAMSHASYPSSRNTTQLPYARAPTAPSPVPFDVPPETSEPTIKKKRKRADARQLEALNRMYARTAFPSTEERQQLARDLDMSARSVQIWFQNKRQASRQGGRNPPANPSISQVAVSLPPDTPPVVMHTRGSSPPVSPMGEASYRSRSPMGAPMRSGQTPSPPSGRTRADIDPRNVRYWGR